MSPAKMTTEQIRAAMRHEVEELNKKNVAVYDETIAPNFVSHNLTTGTDTKGAEAQKQTYKDLLIQFPDRHITIDDTVVEGDKAFVRLTWTGTHKGKLGASAGNLAPTGKKVTMTQFFVRRFAGGKEVERWTMANRLSFYQQLGVTPTADMK